MRSLSLSILRRSSLTLVLLSAACGKKNTEEFPLPKCCRPSKVEDVEDYQIDALTGRARSKVRYDQHQSMRVVLLNVNPFVYDYQVTLNNEPVPEASAIDFFKIIFKTTLPVPQKAGGKSEEKPGGKPPCGNDDAANRLVVDLDHADATLEGTANIFTRLDQLNAEMDKDYEQRRKVIQNPLTGVDVISATVDDLTGLLRNYTTSLRSGHNAIKADLAGVQSRLNDVRKGAADVGACPELNSRIQATGERITVLSTIASTMQAKLAEAEELATRYAEFEGNHGRYSIVRYLDVADRPTNVRVTVQRRPLTPPVSRTTTNSSQEQRSAEENGNKNEGAAPPATVANPNKKGNAESDPPAPPATPSSDVTKRILNFGGRAILTVGAGAFWSNLPDVEYEARPSFTTGNETTKVVARKAFSESRVAPALTLNMRVLDINSPISGVHLTFGLGADLTGTIKPAYFGGLGLGLRDDRVILNFGGLIAERTHLVEGLSLGDRVPDAVSNLGDKRMEWGFAAGLLFRLISP